MKRDYLPTWLQQTLLVSLAVVIVLMPLHAFISTWGGTAIGPLWLWKSWKEILLAGLSVPVIVWLSLKPKRWASLVSDKLFWPIVGFVILAVLMGIAYLQFNGTDAFAAGLAMNTRYFLIFGLAYTLFRFGKFDWPVMRRRMAVFLISAGVLLGAVGLIQVKLLPIDFLSQFGYDKDTTIAPYTLIDENPDALRAFATLRGPNDYGAFLLLPLVLSLLFVKRNKWFLVGTAVILLGIFLSSARSAWLAAIITILALVLLVYGSKVFRSRRAIGIAAISVGVVAVIGFAAVSIPSVRLAVFHSSPGDSSLTEGSTDQHWQATMGGISRVAQQPFGCGTGCAGPASYYSNDPKISENYYVQIAEELGVVGLGLWTVIAGAVGWRLWKLRADWFARGLLASFVGLTAIGFWLHVWSDDPLSLTWWALAGVVLGIYATKSKSTR